MAVLTADRPRTPRAAMSIGLGHDPQFKGPLATISPRRSTTQPASWRSGQWRLGLNRSYNTGCGWLPQRHHVQLASEVAVAKRSKVLSGRAPLPWASIEFPKEFNVNSTNRRTGERSTCPLMDCQPTRCRALPRTGIRRKETSRIDLRCLNCPGNKCLGSEGACDVTGFVQRTSECDQSHE